MWCRLHTVSICKLVLAVAREVCAYFDARRLPDIAKKHLFLYEVETGRRVSFPLAIEAKGRPPLVQIGQTVLIFTCGWTSIIYVENKTYRIDFFGKAQLLSNCSVGLESPAPLYDPERGHIFLFGGASWWGKTRTIQMCDLRSDRWTVIRAKLGFARSHFAAVKYQRHVYFLGGCSESSVETFDLDTGYWTTWNPLPAGVLDNCGALMKGNVLVGLFTHGSPVVVHLDTMTPGTFNGEVREWVGVSKRMWVVDNQIVMMLDFKVQLLGLNLYEAGK